MLMSACCVDGLTCVFNGTGSASSPANWNPRPPTPTDDILLDTARTMTLTADIHVNHITALQYSAVVSTNGATIYAESMTLNYLNWVYGGGDGSVKLTGFVSLLQLVVWGGECCD